VKAAKVNAGLAESNGKLLPGLWRDSLHVTCWLTACTPGSAPGPTLGNEYGKTLPFTFKQRRVEFNGGAHVREHIPKKGNFSGENVLGCLFRHWPVLCHALSSYS